MPDSVPHDKVPLCPSAPPEWEGSRVIGVVGGTAAEPRVSSLSQPLPVTADLLALAAPVTPTEVFRFAAPCHCTGCVHFAERKCTLVERIVTLVPPVSGQLPFCLIRNECRWWQQEGRAACLRCPQVVTDNCNPSVVMRQASTPPAITQSPAASPPAYESAIPSAECPPSAR